MPVLCAVEHLVNTVEETVPMGEQEEVLAEIVRCLVMDREKVDVPKFKYIGVIE
jgi:hypothetical protein